jgi:hypothetical protein
MMISMKFMMSCLVVCRKVTQTLKQSKIPFKTDFSEGGPDLVLFFNYDLMVYQMF